VATLFLDTSALAKLYHREVGSESLERVLHHPNTRTLISRLSIVEMESVCAIKIRSGQLDTPNMEIARRRLRADLAQRRILVGPPVEEKHFSRARRLLFQYGVAEGLRTLDALQLSIALDLHQAGHITVIIAADRRLCRVAELSGCPAINPQVPSSVVIE